MRASADVSATLHDEERGDELGPITATYDYEDELGFLLFQVLRFEPVNGPTQFRQRTGPDQQEWSIAGVRTVLFKLPELIEDIASDRTVFITEGEQDVLTLRDHGVPATTNPMGTGNWRPEFNETFSGADVVIVGDNDESGREHVRNVARQLAPVAKRLRVLDLTTIWPGIKPSDDISDWFERGDGNVEALWIAIEQLPNYSDISAAPTPPDNIGFSDFVALMPSHNYIFKPSRQAWPAASVNARLEPVVGEDGKPMAAAAWLDRNQAVEQMTWAPGEPELIKGD